MRIARSRRRRPRHDGDRIDLRRTLRASVETTGDPIDLRRTARARFGARFVVLIDGSRSTAEHAGPMQFADALCSTTRRANAFVFSTALRDVTRERRERDRARRTLPDLGEAWGGRNAHRRQPRSIHPRLRRTVTVAGNRHADLQRRTGRGRLDRLERAMRELRTRSVGVVWMNPRAGAPGLTPTARGMRTPLPYLSALLPAREERDFAALPRSLPTSRAATGAARFSSVTNGA